MTNIAQPAINNNYLTCPNCGHHGPGVSEHIGHLGGRRMVAYVQCDSIPDCWERWDDQHKPEVKDNPEEIQP